MSVVRERALHTVTNYFIVSLAIADLLVAVVVMPFGVYILVSARYHRHHLPNSPVDDDDVPSHHDRYSWQFSACNS